MIARIRGIDTIIDIINKTRATDEIIICNIIKYVLHYKGINVFFNYATIHSAEPAPHNRDN